MRNLLIAAGVAALLLWTGAGAVAWFLVAERVHVTIADGNASDPRQPDATALLAEQVAAVQADVRALASAMESSVSELQQDVARQGAIAAELRAMLQEQNARPREAEPPSTSAAAAPPPVEVEAAPREAKPAPRSFLAFHLPSATFDFAARQRFEIIPALSRVGFDAKSTLHDFSGVTSQVSGAFTVSLAAPEETPSGHIAARAEGLDTGLSDRNAEMFEHLATREHAEIVFDIDAFHATQVDAAAQSVAGTVHGRMTIRGETRDVEMPVTLQVDASKRVVITGSMALRLTDYAVPVPSKLGVIGMQDEVQVWIALRARAAGASQPSSKE